MDTVYALQAFWALHLVNSFYVFCMFYALRESDVYVKDIVPVAAAATISIRFKNVQGGQCHLEANIFLLGEANVWEVNV